MAQVPADSTGFGDHAGWLEFTNPSLGTSSAPPTTSPATAGHTTTSTRSSTGTAMMDQLLMQLDSTHLPSPRITASPTLTGTTSGGYVIVDSHPNGSDLSDGQLSSSSSSSWVHIQPRRASRAAAKLASGRVTKRAVTVRNRFTRPKTKVDPSSHQYVSLELFQHVAR